MALRLGFLRRDFIFFFSFSAPADFDIFSFFQPLRIANPERFPVEPINGTQPIASRPITGATRLLTAMTRATSRIAVS